MLLIQALLILLILFIITKLFIKIKNKQIGVLSFLIWLVFWMCGLVFIIYQDTLNYLARILGVGRGVDVILYFSLILIFYFIFYFIVRLRKIEQQISEIVRKMALSKNNKEYKNED